MFCTILTVCMQDMVNSEKQEIRNAHQCQSVRIVWSSVLRSLRSVFHFSSRLLLFYPCPIHFLNSTEENCQLCRGEVIGLGELPTWIQHFNVLILNFTAFFHKQPTVKQIPTQPKCVNIFKILLISLTFLHKNGNLFDRGMDSSVGYRWLG